MEEMDILSYGISMTTLEEVFLKVNGDLDDKEKDMKPDKEARSSTVNNEDDEGNNLISEEFKASAEETKDESNNAMSSENLVGKGTLGQSEGRNASGPAGSSSMS